MRSLRILAASVWYFVSTAVNNREPLFWSPLERARFMRVLNEARVRYVTGPPKGAEEYVFAAVVCKAGGGVRRKRRRGAADPAMDAKGRPRTGETARNNGSPPDLPRSTTRLSGLNQPA
ncbi:MAG: hypothetical protein LBK61_14325 [Spirochaetaceae bacterium]|nr:hypothetical protein [Spirochaetaceae bacterium]